MRATGNVAPTTEGAQLMSLDWTSLGSLVRQRTLEAVALHFSMLADASDQQGSRIRSVELLDRSER